MRWQFLATSYRPVPWLIACTLAILVADILAARHVRASRQEAARSALLALRLDLVERARSLEAALRASRSGIDFLAGSGALSAAPGGMASPDPAIARQHRLLAEGELLRFLGAQPGVERLVLSDATGRPIVAVGRRASFPIPIPLEAATLEAPPHRLLASVPLEDEAGTLAVIIHPASLLSALATGLGQSALLDAGGEPLAGTPDSYRRLLDSGAVARMQQGDQATSPDEGDWIISTVTVSTAMFEPAAAWTLARAEREESLAAGIAPLVRWYRATLAVHVAALAAALALGVTAVRLAIRRARLEEKAAREAATAGLEKRLHEADRLAAVGRTAATLAHEVRNPLEGMRNWLELVEIEARDAGATRVLAPAARVREGIDMLAQVVRRVLDLASSARRSFEAVDLNVVADEALAWMRDSPSFRHARIVASLSNEPVRLQGDPVLLGQLLRNLLDNARAVVPEGGTIRVATEITVDEARASVTDNGPGLPAGLEDAMFDMGTSTRGSTGIGLALCRRIATVHGGTIEAANAPGGGACFTLRVPLRAPHPLPIEDNA